MTDPFLEVAGVLATGLRFPEGPAVAPDGTLWAVELQGGALVRFGDGSFERIEVGGAPNGLAWQGDIAWFCDADGRSVRRLHPDGSLDIAVSSIDGLSPDRPNDLAFDPAGNLVFTCPGNSRQEPTGTVWCLRPDGRTTCVADGMYFPNGLAFTQGGDSLIVAETYRHRLWKGGWDPQAATWSTPEVWAEVGGPTGPDGMAFDAAGLLHVAIFGRGEIVAVDETGSIVGRRRTRGGRPTNVAFLPGGGMVVTEAERGELHRFAQAGEAGGLFKRQ